MRPIIRTRIAEDINIENVFSLLPTNLQKSQTVKDRTIYLLSCFTSRGYADKKYSDNELSRYLFLSFPQQFIRKITTTKYEDAIMTAILNSKVVETDNHYITQTSVRAGKSKGYRINPKYSQKTTLIVIQNQKLKKTLRNNFEVKINNEVKFKSICANTFFKEAEPLSDRDIETMQRFKNNKSNYELICAVRENDKIVKPKIEVDFELTKYAYNQFTIDEEKAMKWINENIPEGFKKEKYIYYVDRFVDKTYNITLGNKVNRLYSIFTNLPSDLLQFIRLDTDKANQTIFNISNIYGVTFTEVDTSNCQPLLLNHVINEEYSDLKDKADVILYKKLTQSGNLYQFLFDKVENAGEYKDFKIKLFKFVFFSKKKKRNCPYNKVFKQYFPTVYKIIYDSKKKYSLPARLQNIEADIFVNTNQLFLKKGILNFTRHDSIVCIKEDAELIQKYLQYILQTKYNLIPNFKIKNIS